MIKYQLPLHWILGDYKQVVHCPTWTFDNIVLSIFSNSGTRSSNVFIVLLKYASQWNPTWPMAGTPFFNERFSFFIYVWPELVNANLRIIKHTTEILCNPRFSFIFNPFS